MPEDEMRRRVSAAYEDVLKEPVPGRLSALLAQPEEKIVDFAAARERRKPTRFAGLTWAQLGGMAASVLVGVLIGTQLPALRGGDALVAQRGGDMIASGPLAQALDARLAGDAPGAVNVQLSFVDRSGQYCRTFSAQQLAGLACRDAAQWKVVATARAQPVLGDVMRQAASALPKPVLDAVDAAIAGNTLDATQERAARERGWKK